MRSILVQASCLALCAVAVLWLAPLITACVLWGWAKHSHDLFDAFDAMRRAHPRVAALMLSGVVMLAGAIELHARDRMRTCK